MTPFSPKSRIPVAVLGATGAVGQSFIRLLADLPGPKIRAHSAAKM